MVVACLCRLHRKAGHTVAVHCLFHDGPLAGELEREGFCVHVHGPLSAWRLAHSLYRQFRSKVPDVVHCHNRLATTVAAPPARLARAGAVISTRHGIGGPGYFRLREIKFWLAARWCDRVVAVCPQAHRNMENRFLSMPNRIDTVLNGSLPAPMGPANDEPIQKEGFTLIHVARLARAKDQPTLLKAVALAASRLANLYLWIVGDGPERPALEALAKDLAIEHRIRFLGQREDVGRWLAAADVFVLSSATEGAPVSLLEAMAAGLPFIVTDVGGMPDIARLSTVGTVVPRGRPEALAEAILELFEAREALSAMRVRARRCYDRFFTAERMANDYLRLYQECLRLDARRHTVDTTSLGDSSPQSLAESAKRRVC